VIVLTVFRIADKIGRRPAFWFFGIVLAISLIFETAVMNWQGWLAGRAFGGLGIGCMREPRISSYRGRSRD
jgi:MFS family permease